MISSSTRLFLIVVSWGIVVATSPLYFSAYVGVGMSPTARRFVMRDFVILFPAPCVVLIFSAVALTCKEKWAKHLLLIAPLVLLGYFGVLFSLGRWGP